MSDNKPNLRFPGFSDDWEQRKLSDILTERHILSKISDDYPRLSFTIEEGVIDPENRKTNKRDFLMKDEANKKFLLTEVDDIIYNPANVIFGAIHRNGYGKGCLSPIYRIFKTSQNSRFLECVVRSDTFINKLAQKTEGSVVKLKTLKPEAFMEMSVYITPILEEQEAIANHIDRLDNLITLQQRKCEEIKNLKRGMLQKMFPKEGEQYPESRFPGFTDAWEQRKLSDISIVSTGYPFDSKDFSEDGEYLVITNGNIQNDSEIVDGAVGNRITVSDEKIITSYVLDIGDILVTMDGTVGRTAKVAENMQILAQRVGRLKATIDAEFLYQWLNTGAFSRTMVGLSHGGTIKHISLEEIRSFEYLIPRNCEEQVKIGAFFAGLDNLITLHQRKLDSMKELKKGLLQQMFV